MHLQFDSGALVKCGPPDLRTSVRVCLWIKMLHTACNCGGAMGKLRTMGPGLHCPEKSEPSKGPKHFAMTTSNLHRAE